MFVETVAFSGQYLKRAIVNSGGFNCPTTGLFSGRIWWCWEGVCTESQVIWSTCPGCRGRSHQCSAGCHGGWVEHVLYICVYACMVSKTWKTAGCYRYEWPYSCSSGYEVTTMEDAATRASIFVTATGCRDVLRSEHFLAMRDESICCNIGHFDVEVEVSWLEENCKKDTIKPQVLYARDMVAILNLIMLTVGWGY